MPSRHSERLLPFLLAHARRDLRAISMVFSPNVHLQDGKILVRPQTAATVETPKHPSQAASIEIDLWVFAATATRSWHCRGSWSAGRSNFGGIGVVPFDTAWRIARIRTHLGRSDD